MSERQCHQNSHDLKCGVVLIATKMQCTSINPILKIFERHNFDSNNTSESVHHLLLWIASCRCT